MIATLLDAMESRLALGLRTDAARAELHEATARLLLAVGPEESVRMSVLAQRIVRERRPRPRGSPIGPAPRDCSPGSRATEDRRRRLVQLTDAGRAARARLVAIREERAARLLEAIQAETGLGEGQLQWFLEALGKAAVRSAPDLEGDRAGLARAATSTVASSHSSDSRLVTFTR